MATLTMLDSIDLTQLEWAFTTHRPAAMAGYVGGEWRTWPSLETLYARFPAIHLLSVAVSAAEDAQCLDVETGDAAIPQVYAWFTRQQGLHVWKPCVYVEAANMTALLATMTANAIPRTSWRLWSAHYTGAPHICGPATCGFPQADGTQWTNTYLGRNLDASLLAAGFFPAPPPPFPQPAYTEDAMTVLDMLTPTGPAVALPVPAGKKHLLLYADDGFRASAAPRLRVGFHGGPWGGTTAAPKWDAPAAVPIPAGSVEVTIARLDSGAVPVTVDWA